MQQVLDDELRERLRARAQEIALAQPPLTAHQQTVLRRFLAPAVEDVQMRAVAAEPLRSN